MSEGIPIEEVEFEDEGDSPLPNADFKFANYANMHVKNVIIYGTRILDTFENAFKYRPTMCLFMNEKGTPPQTLCFHMDEIFDDAETMAQMAVAWATMMYGEVSKMVSIFDYETDERIAHLDIQELNQMAVAIAELKKIQRTDMRQIH